MSVLRAFEQIGPTFKRCENGGWLAVSPEDAPLRIGVFAWSADEARNRFLRARAEWCILMREVEAAREAEQS